MTERFNAQPLSTQILKEKSQRKILELSKQPLDLILPYNEDPFVGHLITPISASNLVKTYLSGLSAYKKDTSTLLRGINIGFAHGYFLFGPFTKLGPLRETHAANFGGFISAISIIILLATGLLIYGYVTFKKKNPKGTSDNKLDFLNANEWQQLGSGFTLGGFGGVGVAYLLENMISSNFFAE